jgi:hypothetical protein
MPLKRVDQLAPGDRVRMTIGHATITKVEPLPDERTLLTFLYGAVQPANNHLTVDVLAGDEWGNW